MTNQTTCQYCSNCNAADSSSSFLTYEGEIFHACTVCEGDEIVFLQDLDQNADNGNNLANTAMEGHYGD